MQTLQEMYRAKRGTAFNALNHVRDGDMIVVPTGVGEPPTLLHALSQECRGFRDVQVAQILAMRKYGYFAPECRPHVRYAALFFGGASRAGSQGGWCDFIRSSKPMQS